MVEILLLVHFWCTPADQGILTPPQIDKCRATLIKCLKDKKSFFEFRHTHILNCIEKTKVSSYQ